MPPRCVADRAARQGPDVQETCPTSYRSPRRPRAAIRVATACATAGERARAPGHFLVGSVKKRQLMTGAKRESREATAGFRDASEEDFRDNSGLGIYARSARNGIAKRHRGFAEVRKPKHREPILGGSDAREPTMHDHRTHPRSQVGDRSNESSAWLLLEQDSALLRIGLRGVPWTRPAARIEDRPRHADGEVSGPVVDADRTCRAYKNFNRRIGRCRPCRTTHRVRGS
jgi:hypothetical protein